MHVDGIDEAHLVEVRHHQRMVRSLQEADAIKQRALGTPQAAKMICLAPDRAP
jgi:hypothetical protein